MQHEGTGYFQSTEVKMPYFLYVYACDNILVMPRGDYVVHVKFSDTGFNNHLCFHTIMIDTGRLDSAAWQYSELK